MNILSWGLSPILMIGLTLPFTTCHRQAPPPANVKSAPALGTANTEALSQAAAFVVAGREANQSNPEGAARDAVEGSLATAGSFLPAPGPKHLSFARSQAQAALAGRLADAQAAWALAQQSGDALRQRITALEKQVAAEREAAAVELQNQLSKAQRDADNRQRAIITYILFGSSVLCIIAAVVVANFASVVPQFGPRAALGFGVAGGVLFGLGMAMRIVERMMTEHPLVFWGSLLGVVVALVVAASLIYSNHHRSVDPA